MIFFLLFLIFTDSFCSYDDYKKKTANMKNKEKNHNERRRNKEKTF